MATELEELREERDGFEDEIVDLKEKVEELQDLREEQGRLEAVSEACRTARASAEATAGIEDDLESAETALEEAREDLVLVEEEIGEFDDVEEEYHGAVQTKRETEEAHEIYIQHEKQAAQLEEREARVEDLEGGITDLEDECNSTQDDLEEVRDAFDPEELAKAEEEVEDIRAELHGMRKRMETRESDLEEAEAEVEDLEAILDERAELVEDLKELAADQRFAGWVRERVRDAGPKMRDVITDRIGARADSLFRTIRGRASENLEWTSDYEIVVTNADVRKGFSTLSGGEKMAAALAVRLAIMEQLSTAGVAFLDEPTANLDAQKKANLVEQLERLDAFDQHTVISHDETFETMTEYSVALEKTRQTTEVVAD
jgi:exonuclease SbcC